MSKGLTTWEKDGWGIKRPIYAPDAIAEAEAYNHGQDYGIVSTLMELREIFGEDIEKTDLWQEYINKGE